MKNQPRFILLFLTMLAALIFYSINSAVSRDISPDSSTEIKTFGYPWEKNSLGRSDEVPAPWTDIQYVNGNLECWGRKYMLGDGILPDQITSQEQPIFQSPPELELKIDNHSVLKQPGSSSGYSLKKKNRAELMTLWENHQYQVEVVTSLEYDGLFKVDLKIIPRKSINIDKLVLTLPFNKDVALFFSRFISYDYETQQAERSDLLQSFGPIDKPVSMKFNPAVWVGNHDVGLEWVTETNQGWSNPDPSSVIELVPREHSVVMQVNVISKRASINEPFTLSFGLYPTPVKKLPDDWRKYVFFNSWHKAQLLDSDTFKYFGIGFGFPTKYPGLPIMEASDAQNLKPFGTGKTIQEQISNGRSRMQRQDISFIPYGALYGMPAKLPGNAWKDYAPLWQTMNPRGKARNPKWAELQEIPGREPSIISICPYHESFQDFIVWQYVQAIEKEQIDGLYLDLSTPRGLCQNRNHPHGEFVEKGGEYYPFFRQRELMKRLYLATKARKSDFVITQHQAKNIAIISGFSDMVLSGEALNIFFRKIDPLPKLWRQVLNSDLEAYVPDYSQLPDAFFETQYSQNKGYINTLLPQIIKWNQQLMRRNPDVLEKYSQILLARAALYDIPLYAARVDIDGYNSILKAKQLFGVRGGVRYLGPWESDQILLSGGDKFKVSCYLDAGQRKAMLVIANLTNQEIQDTVSLSRKGFRKNGLSLPDGLRLSDAIQNTTYPADNDKFSVKLPANGYKMLIIQ